MMVFEGYEGLLHVEFENQFFEMIKVFFNQYISSTFFTINIRLFYDYNRIELEKVVKDIYPIQEQNRMSILIRRFDTRKPRQVKQLFIHCWYS